MSKRRKRKTGITLLAENVEFIKEVLLPSNPDEFRGYFTRGVEHCVDLWLGVLDGKIPSIPDRGEVDILLQTESVTLTPETMDAVDAIVAHWHNTDNRRTRSEVADHFITLTRQSHELEQA